MNDIQIYNFDVKQTNIKTGEVVPFYGRIQTQEQIDFYNRKKYRIEQEIIKKRTQNDYGTFVFLLFNYNQDLFPTRG